MHVTGGRHAHIPWFWTEGPRVDYRPFQSLSSLNPDFDKLRKGSHEAECQWVTASWIGRAEGESFPGDPLPEKQPITSHGINDSGHGEQGA